MDTNIFNKLLPVFTESIFGVALDLTTIAVGVFVLALIVFGGDLAFRMLFVSPKSSSVSADSDVSKDRDSEFNKYSRERYWKELYKEKYGDRF
jgi:hypothetical protein